MMHTKLFPIQFCSSLIFAKKSTKRILLNLNEKQGMVSWTAVLKLLKHFKDRIIEKKIYYTYHVYHSVALTLNQHLRL